MADFWESRWREQKTGWDQGHSSPHLVELLENHHLFKTSSQSDVRRVLVPGCGRGYDTLLFASKPGYEALGLDFAETAVLRAEELRDSRGIDKQKAQFKCADFFAFTDPKGFDIVYDLT